MRHEGGEGAGLLFDAFAYTASDVFPCQVLFLCRLGVRHSSRGRQVWEAAQATDLYVRMCVSQGEFVYMCAFIVHG